jgi:hypothetical protein
VGESNVSRPPKITEEIADLIVQGVQAGLTRKAACKSVGVSYSALAAWLARGKCSKENGIEDKYTALLVRIESASTVVWRQNRSKFFFNLKPRDYRYGWSNPMRPETKKKMSIAWRRVREYQRERDQYFR